MKEGTGDRHTKIFIGTSVHRKSIVLPLLTFWAPILEIKAEVNNQTHVL